MTTTNAKPWGSCPTTVWTDIERCRNAGDDQAALDALNGLLARYSPPLQVHLAQAFHASDEQAKDWLQSFVWKKVMLKNLLAKADKSRGRFRSFLFNALQNFVRDELEHDKRQRRKPEGGLVSLDEVANPEGLGGETTPEFDKVWARGILDEALRRMRAECEQTNNTRVWEVFRVRLLEPDLNGSEPIPYKELIERFGFRDDKEAGNALITARRRFARQLRSVIADYARSDDEIDAEIRELRAVFRQLGQGGG